MPPPSRVTFDKLLHGLLENCVFLGVFLNVLLSFINAHMFGVNITTVTVVQAALTAVILIISLIYTKIVSPRLIFSTLALVFLVVSLGIFNNKLAIRSIYDVTVFPICIMAGLALGRYSKAKMLWGLAIVMAISLLDSLAPSSYAEIVNPRSYYNNTRSWAAATAVLQKRTEDEGLYVGAERTEGNIFSFVGVDHRAGGPFLEPLSLGYFAIIFAIIILSSNLRVNTKLYGISYSILLALMADTRLAVALIIIFALLFRFLQRIPRTIPVVLPFIVLGVSALVYSSPLINPELEYRLSLTFDPLASSWYSALLGLVDDSRAGDSGVVYLTSAAGIIGYFLVIYVASGLLVSRSFPAVISLCVVVYLVVTSMFGGAFLSIKTVAVLGTFVGIVARQSLPLVRPKTMLDRDEMSVA